MKTRTPGNFGRPENPDHYLNDDLKSDDEKSRTCWSVEEERAVDQMRVEAEKMWQTIDPMKQEEIVVKAVQAFFQFSVANEIGRQANVIWRAESDFENEQRSIEYKERLKEAVEHFKQQAGEAPYYFSHFWAVEQGFKVSSRDIKDTVLPQKPDPREELMFKIWEQEIEKSMIWDNHLNPHENSPAFFMRGEVLKRQYEGIEPDKPTGQRAAYHYDSFIANMAVVARMPMEIIDTDNLVKIYKEDDPNNLEFKANSWEMKEPPVVSEKAKRALGSANLRAKMKDFWDSATGQEYRNKE